MKILFALFLPVLSATAGSPAGRPVIVPARPLGATFVSLPSSRPLGGVALPGSTTLRRKNGRSTVGSYFGPVYYTPGLSDGYGYADSSGSATAAPPAPTQPIVINQYFASNGSGVPGAVNTAEAPPAVQEAAAPGDLLAPVQNYYLIRYKDRSIFSALTYWIEGDTLHYVTTQNTHNQASLELIDIDQTYKLNADHSVPFAIPGR